jgi:hypothetical protein
MRCLRHAGLQGGAAGGGEPAGPGNPGGRLGPGSMVARISPFLWEKVFETGNVYGIMTADTGCLVCGPPCSKGHVGRGDFVHSFTNDVRW